ncbi:MAG: hypothetical protein N2C14_19860, partial [Planctomycetales bacterium]
MTRTLTTCCLGLGIMFGLALFADAEDAPKKRGREGAARDGKSDPARAKRGKGRPGGDQAKGKRPQGRPGGDFAKRREEFLKKYDKNGNGKLDPEEREAAAKERGGRPGAGGRPGSGGRMAGILQQFDKNKDGGLDKSELET